jgi:hypothetical protein
MTDELEWILFLSQLPTTPSSLRVTVWRRMKGAGAIRLHNGVWALPFSSKNQQFMNEIFDYVTTHDGNASIFISRPASSNIESGLKDAFTRNIEQDYKELIGKCKGFLKELESEISQKKFTFVELDENEEELHKLNSLLRKIRLRDYFDNPVSQEAKKVMETCRKELMVFARSVYTNEGIEVPENELHYSDE